MKTISGLLKHVSLHTIKKIPQLEKDELLVVLFKDDAGAFDCNRKVKVAGSLLQLDAVLCYAKRKVDKVVKMKVVESYV